MNAPHAPDTESTSDQALKHVLRHTLDVAPSDDTEALQARVVAQWRQATSTRFERVSHGPVAALRAAWRHHPVLWSGALLVLALAAWQLRSAHDTAMDDLMQPDVLTLISAGEL